MTICLQNQFEGDIDMLITVNRNKFYTAVQQVQHAVNSRTPIPILTGILLSADENGLILSGSNSDISIQTRIPVMEENRTEEENENEPETFLTVHRPGRVVLPGRYAAEMIRRLDGDDIIIEGLANHTTKIVCGKAEFLLNCMDPEEYPELPSFVWPFEDSFELPGHFLKKLIQQTVFAVAETQSRPILTGVCWESVDGQLVLTATNSHRLARRSATFGELPPMEQAVIPGKSLQELMKLIDDDESVHVAFTQNQMVVRTVNLLYTSRRLEGFYPDTSRIIPQAAKTHVRLSKRMLHDAVDRAYLFAREIKNNVVKCSLKDNTTLVITADTPSVGQVTETVPIYAAEGELSHIAFNARYMLEALKAIDSEDVDLLITGPMSPFIVRPEGDDTLIQLILPVRTR
mgnify:CR=1 FL=1